MRPKAGKRKADVIQRYATEDDLKKLLAAVDGSFRSSGDKMREFLDKDLLLEPQDLNRLLTAFIIDYKNPLSVELGLSNNVPGPSTKYNQFTGDNKKWSEGFMSKYATMFTDPDVDKILVILFVQSYNLTTKLNDYLPQNETENLKTLRLILDSLTQDNSSKENIDSIFRIILDRQKNSNTSTPKNNILEEKDADVLDNLLKNKKITIVVGSGVSVAVVEPEHKEAMTWSNLIKLLLEDVEAFLDKPLNSKDVVDGLDLTLISDNIINFLKVSQSPIDLQAFVHQRYRSIRPAKKSMDLCEMPLCEAINALKAPISTTNYDTTLEECLDRHYINLPNHKFAKNEKLYDRHNRLVYHLHGVYSEPASFVLAASEYKKNFLSFLEALFHILELGNECRSLLFIGCGEGIFDEHFSAAFRILDRLYPENPHFALVNQRDVQEFEGRKNNIGISNLKFLSYGSNYDALPGYLWSLARRAGHESTEHISLITSESAILEKLSYNDSKQLVYSRQECSSKVAKAMLNGKNIQVNHGKNSGLKVRALVVNGEISYLTTPHRNLSA
ncbi:hypothetical protein MP638_002700 [Amoeboaphelidium occidentale]|nr:hypothetical protein MP638_002700 [Amoeboaphelidium occidentale]